MNSYRPLLIGSVAVLLGLLPLGVHAHGEHDHAHEEHAHEQSQSHDEHEHEHEHETDRGQGRSQTHEHDHDGESHAHDHNDDHDHDHAPSPTAAPAVEGALPRFAIQAHGLELVGVLDGDELTLYLDDWHDNSPVTDAQLTLQLDGVAVEVEQSAPGTFDAHLPALPEQGAIAVQARVVRGASVERLQGELTPAHAEHDHDDAPSAGRPLLLWLLGGLAALALLFWAVRHARSDSRAS
ncbi:hypothetical protein [Pseudomonas mangrovi]|uniref:Uncharacterized protein n=1 Tax=Pseudomonas mangrovi TaxID=2161748 RepID=A0A2T5P4U0_9PSED|nr:hypothetical protein [Pseudomonas mangrovi]PTU72724.1 hypothetical protein DBO85_18380 [Pseudomonas mangrovi]